MTMISSEDIAATLRNTTSYTAVEMAKMLGMDWANDMDEEGRQATRELAMDLHRRIADRLGITL